MIFSQNAIKSLLDYLNDRNKKILIAPRLLNSDGSIQHSIYSFQSLWLSFTTYFFLYLLFPKSKYFNRYYLINRGVDEITTVETITGAFMLFKKEDILQLNGFDEDYFFYGEDNDLCKRFRDSGGNIIYYPKVEVTHLKGATKKTNWFHVKYHTLSVVYLFRKHYNLPKRILARILFFLGIILRSILHIANYSYTLNAKHLEEFKLKIKALPIIIKGKA
jgi:GT2 family glycosyltransferase